MCHYCHRMLRRAHLELGQYAVGIRRGRNNAVRVCNDFILTEIRGIMNTRWKYNALTEINKVSLVDPHLYAVFT